MQLTVEVKISEQISKLAIYDFLYADMHHFWGIKLNLVELNQQKES